jgi:hypothetical protein
MIARARALIYYYYYSATTSRVRSMAISMNDADNHLLRFRHTATDAAAISAAPLPSSPFVAERALRTTCAGTSPAERWMDRFGTRGELLADTDARATLGDYATYVTANGDRRTLLLNTDRVVVLTRRRDDAPLYGFVVGHRVPLTRLAILTDEDIAYCRRHGFAYAADEER